MPRKKRFTKPLVDKNGQKWQEIDWKTERDRTSHLIDNIKPKSENQKIYLETMDESLVTFCCGPAGTGKSLLALAVGIKLLRLGEVDKIVCMRAPIEVGKGLGYLPGSASEKIAAYMGAFENVGEKLVGKEEWTKLVKDGKVVYTPVSFIRGQTWDRTFLLCDESQNLCRTELVTIVTRLGEESRAVICGDVMQCDLDKKHNEDAFETMIQKLERKPIDGVNVVYLDDSDVCRSRLVKDFVKLFGEGF